MYGLFKKLLKNKSLKIIKKIISAQNRRKYALYIGIAQNRRKPPPFFNVVYVNGLAYCKVWAPILICARYIHIYYLYYIGKTLWIGEISMLELNKILMDAVALYAHLILTRELAHPGRITCSIENDLYRVERIYGQLIDCDDPEMVRANLLERARLIDREEDAGLAEIIDGYFNQ